MGAAQLTMIAALLATWLMVGGSDKVALGVCSCALSADTSAGVRQALTEASETTIFEGRVLSIVDTTVLSAVDSGKRPVHLVTLDVRRAWKGVESDTVRLLVSPDLCAYPFHIDKMYVVFAGAFTGLAPSEPVRLGTSICSYTTPAHKPGAIRTALGQPRRERRKL